MQYEPKIVLFFSQLTASSEYAGCTLVVYISNSRVNATLLGHRPVNIYP